MKRILKCTSFRATTLYTVDHTHLCNQYLKYLFYKKNLSCPTLVPMNFMVCITMSLIIDFI